jgi:hypothetical protein
MTRLVALAEGLPGAAFGQLAAAWRLTAMLIRLEQ